MRIKITNCNDSMLWYNKHIGYEFEVRRVSPGLFWVRELDEYQCLNLVKQEHAEIVEPSNLYKE